MFQSWWGKEICVGPFFHFPFYNVIFFQLPLCQWNHLLPHFSVIKSSISLHFIFFSLLPSCWLHLPFYPPWLSLVTASFISLLPPVWRWGIQCSSVCVCECTGWCVCVGLPYSMTHVATDVQSGGCSLMFTSIKMCTIHHDSTKHKLSAPAPYTVIYRNNWTLEHEELRDANIQLQSLSAYLPVSLEHTHPSHTHTLRLVKCNLANWNGKSLINYIQGHKLYLPPST